MVIRAVQLAAGEGRLYPSEDGLMAHVHAEGDLGLAAVAAEVSLPEEQPDEQPFLEFRRHRLAFLLFCFTVRYHVKRLTWP
jgi:hypothetical protein